MFALPDPASGAAGSANDQLADALRRRVRVVSGIMQAEAAELTAVDGGAPLLVALGRVPKGSTDPLAVSSSAERCPSG